MDIKWNLKIQGAFKCFICWINPLILRETNYGKMDKKKKVRICSQVGDLNIVKASLCLSFLIYKMEVKLHIVVTIKISIIPFFLTMFNIPGSTYLVTSTQMSFIMYFDMHVIRYVFMVHSGQKVCFPFSRPVWPKRQVLKHVNPTSPPANVPFPHYCLQRHDLEFLAFCLAVF